MGYSSKIGKKYIKQKGFNVISVITYFSIIGVAVSVAVLTTVTTMSSGFEAEFQRKILGVNAHVLVIKYGFDFSEYREYMSKIKRYPHVKAINPFIINRMMIIKDEHVSPVLVKGVDPELMPQVLDLPEQMIKGSLNGLRIKGRHPAQKHENKSTKNIADGILYNETNKDDEEKEKNTPKSSLSENEISEAIDNALDENEVVKPKKAEPIKINSEKLPGIVIGKTLAADLKINIGDVIKLISPIAHLDTSLWRPSQEIPSMHEFKVIGIFHSGFQEYDTQLVFVDLFEEQRFYNKGDVVNGLEIKLDDLNNASYVAKILDKKLGGSPYNVIDWEGLNHGLFQALRIQKIALVSVFAMLVAIAGLLIISTLVMLIFEKKREIAILKSMGSTNFQIMKIFLTFGIIVGVIGVLIGLVLGSGTSLFLYYYGWPLDPEVYYIDHLPVEIKPWDYLIISVVSFLTCLISTSIPSYFTAAKMHPVDGLRYE